MIYVDQFGGGGQLPPKNIVNAFSTNGFTARSVAPGYCRQILAGALTANVLKPVLSVAGSGVVNFLSFFRADAVSKALRCRVTLDGAVVFDATDAAINAQNFGGVVIGTTMQAATPVTEILDHVPFGSSLLVEIASSATETNGSAIGVIYKTC